MNCLELHRHLLAAPHSLSPEMKDHLLHCDACKAAVEKARRFEDRLEETLRVPVPKGLAEMVLVRQQLAKARARRSMAIAALLVMGVGASLLYPPLSRQHLIAESVILHVLDESATLSSQQSVPPQQVAAAFAGYGARLTGDIGKVRYLQQKPVAIREWVGGREVSGTHMVLDSPFGRATVILTAERLAAANLTLEKKGLVASVMPVGTGSCAIVAESEATVKAVEALLQRHLVWVS